MGDSAHFLSVMNAEEVVLMTVFQALIVMLTSGAFIVDIFQKNENNHH